MHVLVYIFLINCKYSSIRTEIYTVTVLLEMSRMQAKVNYTHNGKYAEEVEEAKFFFSLMIKIYEQNGDDEFTRNHIDSMELRNKCILDVCKLKQIRVFFLSLFPEVFCYSSFS